MASIHSKDRFYDILRYLVDGCTRRTLRKIRTFGKDNIPRDGVLIFAPNHCNTLLDALVVLQSDHRPSAYGARADIFRKPSTAKILRWLRIVPMARFRDGLSEVKNNYAVFDEAAECAIAGVPFCIFAEGAHTPGYEVQPIKSGIFRIAEAARAKTDRKIHIIPIGLSYSDFYRPKPDIDIRFGEALDADEILAMEPKRRSEVLHEKIQELVVRPEVQKKTPLRWVNRILLSPVYLAGIILSSPIWIASESIIHKLKDKAWSNTVRFACGLGGTILLTLIYAILGFIFLPWYWALALLVFSWFAPNFFYMLFR